MKKPYKNIKNYLKEIGKRLHFLREKKFHETQKEFAQKLGKHQSHISNIAMGESGPSVETLIKLSRLSVGGERINIDWLLTGEGSPTIPLQSGRQTIDNEILNIIKLLDRKKKEIILRWLEI